MATLLDDVKHELEKVSKQFAVIVAERIPAAIRTMEQREARSQDLENAIEQKAAAYGEAKRLLRVAEEELAAARAATEEVRREGQRLRTENAAVLATRDKVLAWVKEEVS